MGGAICGVVWGGRGSSAARRRQAQDFEIQPRGRDAVGVGQPTAAQQGHHEHPASQRTGTGEEHQRQPQQPLPPTEGGQRQGDPHGHLHQRVGQKMPLGQEGAQSVHRSHQRPQRQTQGGHVLPADAGNK